MSHKVRNYLICVNYKKNNYYSLYVHVHLQASSIYLIFLSVKQNIFNTMTIEVIQGHILLI